MFRLLRFYAIASFMGMLVAALLLVMFYRQIAVGSIVELGESSNIVLSHTLLNSVKPLLVAYLVELDTDDPALIHSHPMNRILRNALAALREDSSVVKIKIYNRQGVVVYSTDASQLGENQSDNQAWRLAIQGTITSKLIYRDTFNVFDQVTEDDNLIQTYQPVRTGFDDPVQGVFEIYTDVDQLVRDIEHSEFQILAGVLAIMTVLYGLLLLVVRRAAGIIDHQQAIIEARNWALERLSSQLIRGQEEEKQHLAGSLHEGIAQTLSAVKMHVETVGRLLDRHRPEDGEDRQQRLEAVVPVIQQAIQEVRGLAMDLRPASLDELGLIATLRWYCREFRSVYPDAALSVTLAVEEAQIPETLRIIIYRIVQDTLTLIARRDGVHGITLCLSGENSSISLVVEDDDPLLAAEPEPRWPPSMRERTTLSGGVYRQEQRPAGGLRRHSRWSTVAPIH